MMVVFSDLQLLVRNVLMRLKNIPKLKYFVIALMIIVLNLMRKLFLVLPIYI